MKVRLFILLFLLSFSQAMHAKDSLRNAYPIGFTVGIMDPYPSLLGIHVSYNFTKSFRTTLGYGYAGSQEASLNTFMAGFKFLIFDWKIAPFISINFANATHQGTKAIHKVVQDLYHLYSSFGLDWQTETGFNLGAAFNLSWTGSIPATPSLYLGWYFNLSDLF